MCIDEDSCVKNCQSLNVEGIYDRGRTGKTWDEVVKQDLQILGPTEVRKREMYKKTETGVLM